MRSGSSCTLGEVLEHSEKVGPGGAGSIYIHIYTHTDIPFKVSVPFPRSPRMLRPLKPVKCRLAWD